MTWASLASNSESGSRIQGSGGARTAPWFPSIAANSVEPERGAESMKMRLRPSTSTMRHGSAHVGALSRCAALGGRGDRDVVDGVGQPARPGVPDDGEPQGVDLAAEKNITRRIRTAAGEAIVSGVEMRAEPPANLPRFARLSYPRPPAEHMRVGTD